MKICYAASSGGHYAQILQLRPIMEKCDGFIVTEKTETYQDNGERTYFLKQTNIHFVFCVGKGRIIL